MFHISPVNTGTITTATAAGIQKKIPVSVRISFSLSFELIPIQVKK